MDDDQPEDFEAKFQVQYRSTVDGDRCVIIAPEVADMTGWSIDVVPGNINGVDRQQFSRQECFYRSFPGSPWGTYGYGGAKAEYPWTAFVDHDQTIIDWIPPDEN